MARINTNIPSLIAQANLKRSNADLALRLQRLATGLRINRGADDPAGLIVSERLRSEMQGISQAVSNSERASSVIATSEGYLTEVADLLISIKGLIVETANSDGLSQQEIEANQLQVNSAIDAITRIANTASFAGLQLLDGSLEYLTSGVATSAILGVDIFGAKFGINPTVPVQVEVVSSAQTGALFLSGNTVGAPGALLSSVSIEIVGNLGIQSVSFISGTSLSAVVSAVNTFREATGVSASLVNPADQTSGLTFNSVGYGSDQFVSVRTIGEGGDFFSVHLSRNGPVTERDEGRDVSAVVNGALAAGRGLDVTLNTPALSLELNLTPVYGQTTGSMKSFEITGGGAVFQLGPRVSPSQQVGFGLQSVAASRLGGNVIDGVRYFLDSIAAGRPNSLIAGGAEQASKIVDAAISETSLLRGRLGALERNTIQTNIRSLQVGLENVTASESKIRDADFAAETAALTRAQILTQAGTSVLATANVMSQNVLVLLR
ncbi:MAG: flagellin N-terminal helical domain-containing protein [Planctomycetota bacterium]|jgi:flagellin